MLVTVSCSSQSSYAPGDGAWSQSHKWFNRGIRVHAIGLLGGQQQYGCWSVGCMDNKAKSVHIAQLA
jgi:hypothetical protein